MTESVPVGASGKGLLQHYWQSVLRNPILPNSRLIALLIELPPDTPAVVLGLVPRTYFLNATSQVTLLFLVRETLTQAGWHATSMHI